MSGLLRLIVVLGLTTALILGAISCHDQWDYGTKISVCDAVSTARQEVPPRIAEYSPAAGFRQEPGSKGTWFVSFPNVNTTPEELGWGEGKPYETYTDNISSQGLPAGTFRNVTIYVDAETGEVTGRGLSTRLFVGGPGVFPHCDE
jgi:hypothetical protein